MALLLLPEDLTTKIAWCLTYFDTNRLRASSTGGRCIGNAQETLTLDEDTPHVRFSTDHITSAIAVFSKLKRLSLWSKQLTGD